MTPEQLEKKRAKAREDMRRHLASLTPEQRREWNRRRIQNQNDYEARYPEKIAAKKAVQRAVRRGELVRPDHCEKCGVKGPIQGSHDDYSKPLEVEWLCATCHNAKDAGYRVEERAPRRPNLKKLPEAIDLDEFVSLLESIRA